MMQLTITVRADPRQLQDMPNAGKLSRTKTQTIWTAAVAKAIKEAGFEAVMETGPGFDAYCDWHLAIGNHTVQSHYGKMEGLDHKELAATILGDCQCSGGPCGCSVRAREVVAGLLSVILRNAQSVVEDALAQGEFAVEDGGRGFLRTGDEEDR